MDHTPAAVELRELSDDQLAALASLVAAEQDRRFRLRRKLTRLDELRVEYDLGNLRPQRGGELRA